MGALGLLSCPSRLSCHPAVSLPSVPLPARPVDVLRLVPGMDEVTTETPTPEQPQPQSDAPLIPSEPVPPIESRFLFVDVAALRAKQLRRGARLRILSDEGMLPKKAERLAMEEVRRGLVMYEVPARKSNGADAS